MTRRLLACLLLLAPAAAGAEPTEIVVRVLARDAKFVGTSMGGARVILRDAATGTVLASGLTRGSTGDTARIVTEPRERGRPLATGDTAAFTARIDIDEPTRVRASAHGPLGQPQAAVTVTSTQWVIPGRHVNAADGWILELPGFVVDVLEPAAHQRLPAETDGVSVHANVTLMCGCPVEPGGPWDADRYEVAALLERDGVPVGRFPLEYAGETSRFSARLPIGQPGAYQATVYAWDPATGNTGLDRTTFLVAPPPE